MRCERAWRATEALATEMGWAELTVLAAAGKLLDEADGDAEAAMRAVPPKAGPGGAWWDVVLETLFALWVEEPKTPRASLRLVPA